MKKILILGAGGNSPGIVEAIELINAADAADPKYKLEGYLDDLPENEGRSVSGYQVLGRIEDAGAFHDCHFVNAISSVGSFRQIRSVVERTAVPRSRFETIVHPRAIVSSSATVGAGCSIMAGSVLCAGVEIGDHVIILENTSVNDRSRLGDFVTLSAGVTVLDAVDVGPSVLIGGGATVASGLKIGEFALVGAGSVVIADVAPGIVMAGNPARRLPNSRYALQGTSS